MRHQVSLVTKQNRMLLLVLIELRDGGCDLPHQIATAMRGLKIESGGDLPQQIERGTGGEVNVENLEGVGMQRSGEHSSGC